MRKKVEMVEKVEVMVARLPKERWGISIMIGGVQIYIPTPDYGVATDIVELYNNPNTSTRVRELRYSDITQVVRAVSDMETVR